MRSCFCGSFYAYLKKIILPGFLRWGFWGKSNPLKNDKLEIDLFKIESRNN